MEALWVNGRSNPPWVEAELAAMAQGNSQLPLFSWNQKLAKYAKDGNYQKTLELFEQMQKENMIPNSFTFIPVLKACANLGELEKGRQIHAQIIQGDCESNLFISTALVDMYAKCGSIEDAQRVFNLMPTRDVVTWNAMILGHVKCGQGQKALELFARMQMEGMQPETLTFVGVLSACAMTGGLQEGRHVHAQIAQNGCESDIILANSLIDMYAKCGSIKDAEGIFAKMLIKDVVSWNVMIAGYVKCGQGKKALALYREMQIDQVKPVISTFVAVLSACANEVAVEEGRGVHRQIIQSGCESHVFIASSLINMYSKCGNIEDAWQVFEPLPAKDIVSWNAMIMGFVKYGQGQKAIDLYGQMREEMVEPDPLTFVGVLNACASVAALEVGRHVHRQIIQSSCESFLSVGNSLVDMYGKCGSIEEAEKVFDKMHVRDVVSWNTIILGHGKCGQGQKALELYQQMQVERVEPVTFTFVAILNACASIAAIKEGRRIHSQIIQAGCESDVFIGSSLVDMYLKCGSIDDAQRAFSKMSRRDVVSWNTMILGYVKCGQGQKALKLYQQMQMECVDPSPLTFVGVLNACASVSALEEGRRVHARISQNGCEADLFVRCSLIDMYAKCGSIEEAERTFSNCPNHEKGYCNAMLRGYAMHGYAQECVELFDRMLEDGVEIDRVTFVSLLSACSHAGLVEEGLHYFEFMTSSCGLSATVEHYACIVDLLGRAGRLYEAEALIKSMLCEPDVTVWTALLGACRLHGDIKMGERIAKQVLELDPGDASGYVALSNIYAAKQSRKC